MENYEEKHEMLLNVNKTLGQKTLTWVINPSAGDVVIITIVEML